MARIETISRTIYQFDELSESAQQRRKLQSRAILEQSGKARQARIAAAIAACAPIEESDNGKD